MALDDVYLAFDKCEEEKGDANARDDHLREKADAVQQNAYQAESGVQSV